MKKRTNNNTTIINRNSWLETKAIIKRIYLVIENLDILIVS